MDTAGPVLGRFQGLAALSATAWQQTTAMPRVEGTVLLQTWWWYAAKQQLWAQNTLQLTLGI